MDAVHFHLVLNHFPIIGTIIGAGILAYGLLTKNNSNKKVALFIMFLMAVVTIPVFLSGHEAEEIVEHLAGVSEDYIEEHEELAEKALWLMSVLGLLSLAGLYSIWKKLSYAKIITVAVLIVSLITIGIMAKVGNFGGQIRHSEIRNTSSIDQ